MYKLHGYNCITIYLEDGKQYNLFEHRLNALLKYSLHDVINKDNIIHHKNNCKLDNSLDNLIILSRSEHNKLHNNSKKSQWKDYARIIKGGFNKDGKRQYKLKYRGKVIQTSIFKNKLQKIVDEINRDEDQ